MNTHHGYIQHLDSRITFVAAGNEASVRESLATWVANHPLSFYDTTFIVEIVEQSK